MNSDVDNRRGFQLDAFEILVDRYSAFNPETYSALRIARSDQTVDPPASIVPGIVVRRKYDDMGQFSVLALDPARIIEGQALWHLNRVADARRVLTQIREELLSKPTHLTTAACSATLAAALIASGSWTEGREFATEALVLARRVRVPDGEHGLKEVADREDVGEMEDTVRQLVLRDEDA